MNTADKSIGTIDYAIRRRFLFFDCLPNEDVVEKYNIQTGGKTQEDINSIAIYMMENLKRFIDLTINKGYHAKDLYIGHTYFLVKNEDELKLRLQYQIVPILREYYENGVLKNDLDKTEEIKIRYSNLIEAIKGTNQPKESQSDESLFDALYNEIINSNAINMMKNLKRFIDLTINKGHHAKDRYIGHTYFLVNNEDELKQNLQNKIVPILREYYENGVLKNDLDKMEEIKTRYPKLIEAIKGKDQSYDSQSDDSLFDALYDEIKEEIKKECDSDESAK